MTEPAAAPVDPPPISKVAAIAYAVLGVAAAPLLLFWPAGSFAWAQGWLFIVVTVGAFWASALVMQRVNPVIFRARSRFQPGTKDWDKQLLALMFPAMAAILPCAALDVARDGWVHPLWVYALGYALLLGGVALTAWAQAVNGYFEPGVRIQTERRQHVIDTGPYAFVRHPGYVGAIALFAGMALSLGSVWALFPAAIASTILVVRTHFEDRLLRAQLAGYQDYARRIRWRLLPGVW